MDVICPGHNHCVAFNDRVTNGSNCVDLKEEKGTEERMAKRTHKLLKDGNKDSQATGMALFISLANILPSVAGCLRGSRCTQTCVSPSSAALQRRTAGARGSHPHWGQ